MPSNHLILCCPLLLCPQSFPASGSFLVSQLLASGSQSIGVSASSFSFQFSASSFQLSASSAIASEYLGLTSFRTDSFDLLAVQEETCSQVSNTRIQKHQLFGVQPSSWKNFMYYYFADYLCFFLLMIKCLKNNNQKFKLHGESWWEADEINKRDDFWNINALVCIEFCH